MKIPKILKYLEKKRFYFHHSSRFRFISGWEWIYTNQNDPPYFIQLDGETSGGKIQALKDYKLWFLNDDLTCNNKTVNNALKMVLKGQVWNSYVFSYFLDIQFLYFHTDLLLKSSNTHWKNTVIKFSKKGNQNKY